MKRPPDREPFYIDKDGNEVPMFVPPNLLDAARKANPRTWIEPTPMLPTGDTE